jgi:glycosyltransferase involved in cell wall biosynthesis
MRLLVHDFGCYSFTWQLARSLHERGHDVAYCYSAAEPKRSDVADDEGNSFSSSLSACAVRVSHTLRRESLFQRHRWTRQYGLELAKNVRAFQPEVVLSANTPLDAQRACQEESRRVGAKFVYWLQDVLSVATRNIVSRRRPWLGALAGWYYERLERTLLQQSDEVIAITQDFMAFTDRWKVPRSRVHVIENWSPLDEFPLLPRDNAWSTSHGLNDQLCVMYAGQLGMKHNPDLLKVLAQRLRNQVNTQLVILAEGPAVNAFREYVVQERLENVKLLPFQAYSDLPAALASADVLIAVLDNDGASYCVPSKVLTYLCSGKPIVLSVAAKNLVAQIVEGNGAGLVVEPDNSDGFAAAITGLLNDKSRRGELSRNARAYAETHFDIEQLTDRFELILGGPVQAVAEDSPDARSRRTHKRPTAEYVRAGS